MIHREAGQAVFVHECEFRSHALTISWGAFYPALDVDSMPQVILPNGKSQFCHCDGDYARVGDGSALGGSLCPPNSRHLGVPPGEDLPSDQHHHCHPIAGHVERSDDHTANLIPTPEPDPDEQARQRLQTLHWILQTKHMVRFLEEKIAAGKYEGEDKELQLEADQIVVRLAKRDLARVSP